MAKLKKEAKVIAGFLASALDIEDDMSSRVYGDFLDRGKWPKELNEDAFGKIKELLTVLIKETEEHKKIFYNLSDQTDYGKQQQ